MSLIDYKELICKLRIAGMTEGNCELLLNTADAIEELTARCSQLERECNAYAKCFRINRTDDVFANHAVFKLDYNELINNSEDEIALALAWRLARMIKNHSVVDEVDDG